MKIISYSLFKDCQDWEFGYYLRGVYFNLRMNRLLYPGWVTSVYVQQDIYNQYEQYFSDLSSIFPDSVFHVAYKLPRCEAMLLRLKPAFNERVTHIICRDLDSITTYREMKSVEHWVYSGKKAHGINDSPAHGGMVLMGGMCGFRADVLRDSFNSFNDIVHGKDLDNHGDDQNLLGMMIYPIVKDDTYFDVTPAYYYDNPLWESDLTCRHIGSAGVVDMELLRFFHRHDKENQNYKDFETKHRGICYWR